MIKTILSLPGNQPTRDELLQQLVRPCLFLLASPVGIFVILNPTDRMIISSTNSVDSRSPKEWIRAAGPTGQTSGEGILARLKIAR